MSPVELVASPRSMVGFEFVALQNSSVEATRTSKDCLRTRTDIFVIAVDFDWEQLDLYGQRWTAFTTQAAKSSPLWES